MVEKTEIPRPTDIPDNVTVKQGVPAPQHVIDALENDNKTQLRKLSEIPAPQRDEFKITPKMAKVQRNQISVVLDREKILEHAGNLVGVQDMADMFAITKANLVRQYGQLILKAKAEARAKIARLQMEACEKLNPQLLIWMGKQHLGQSEKVDQTFGGEGGFTINIGNKVEVQTKDKTPNVSVEAKFRPVVTTESSQHAGQ